ncbi:probable deoxycytidylate deaminase [Drosophila grimshawi]|uniref:Probable deoxycytidylate deaminase n=1 Tax=Drosophila grimshawi TaxID=7222 RepID=B4IYQ9_DROGR|nr:probable deoxycytidylate deaminase [Drosophila grimshawi]EDV96596.1 GH15113 [Drosophila grimshawi]
MSKDLRDDSEEATEITASLNALHIQKRQDYLQWDDYFMATAILSSKRSKDPSTQVGACIVDKHKRIVAIGYNGFPRNCSDDVFPWSKDSDSDSIENKNMYVVHAEANAILNGNGASLDGTRLYTTLFPCNECTKLIIQSGIRNILYISDKYSDKPTYRASKRMLNAVGIIYQQHVPTQRQIVINFDDFTQQQPK